MHELDDTSFDIEGKDQLLAIETLFYLNKKQVLFSLNVKGQMRFWNVEKNNLLMTL